MHFTVGSESTELCYWLLLLSLSRKREANTGSITFQYCTTLFFPSHSKQSLLLQKWINRFYSQKNFTSLPPTSRGLEPYTWLFCVQVRLTVWFICGCFFLLLFCVLWLFYAIGFLAQFCPQLKKEGVLQWYIRQEKTAAWKDSSPGNLYKVVAETVGTAKALCGVWH